MKPHYAFLLLCAGVATSALSAAPFTWQSDFNNLSNVDITETASAATDWFYKADSNPWYIKDGVVEGLGGDRAKPNPLNARSYIVRDLTAGSLLPVGQSLTDASVAVDSSWRWGNKDSAYFATYVGLLNNDGNGYMAMLTNGGIMYIYQVQNGPNGTYTELAQKTVTLNFANGGNGSSNTQAGEHLYQRITFAVENGKVLLDTSITAMDGLSFNLSADSAYSDFTKVVLGSRQATGELIFLDNVLVNGATIPESGMGSVLLGGAVTALLLLNLRKRRARS